MTATSKNKTLFWVFTLLLLLPTAGGGIPELLMAPSASTLETLNLLGYPLYILKILGFAKIMGAIAITNRRFVRMNEWAYAGYTFLFLGAAASHIFAGDFAHAPIPLVFLALLMASYFYSHKSSADREPKNLNHEGELNENSR